MRTIAIFCSNKKRKIVIVCLILAVILVPRIIVFVDNQNHSLFSKAELKQIRSNGILSIEKLDENEFVFSQGEDGSRLIHSVFQYDFLNIDDGEMCDICIDIPSGLQDTEFRIEKVKTPIDGVGTLIWFSSHQYVYLYNYWYEIECENGVIFSISAYLKEKNINKIKEKIESMIDFDIEINKGGVMEFT